MTQSVNSKMPTHVGAIHSQRIRTKNLPLADPTTKLLEWRAVARSAKAGRSRRYEKHKDLRTPFCEFPCFLRLFLPQPGDVRPYSPMQYMCSHPRTYIRLPANTGLHWNRSKSHVATSSNSRPGLNTTVLPLLLLAYKCPPAMVMLG